MAMMKMFFFVALFGLSLGNFCYAGENKNSGNAQTQSGNIPAYAKFQGFQYKGPAYYTTFEYPKPIQQQPRSLDAVQVMGNSYYVANAEAALRLIKQKSPEDYELIRKYAPVINQPDPLREDAPHPKKIVIEEMAVYFSPTWCAGAIAYASALSKFYDDNASSPGYAPKKDWKGKEANQKCREYQLQILQKINAPSQEIEYARSAADKDLFTKRPDGSSEVLIVADTMLVMNINAALDLLRRKSPQTYQLINQNIGMIAQADHTCVATRLYIPTIMISKEVGLKVSIPVLAGILAHETYHAKLYHDYKANHTYDPSSYGLSTRQPEELKCIAYELEVLEKIGGDRERIEQLKKADGTHPDADKDGDVDKRDFYMFK